MVARTTAGTIPVPIVEAGVHTPALMERHAARVLPVHELIAVQSGCLPIAEEDHRFAVRGTEWVLLRAGHHHHGYDLLADDTWFYWVCFGDAPQPDAVRTAVVQGPRTGRLVRPDWTRMLFERLLDDQRAAALTPAAARGYLDLILAEILRPPSTTPGDPPAALLAREAATFIADHVTDPDLGTARVARALAFNPDYLGRCFRDTFGETVTDHIHRLRIHRARVLLRSTELPTDHVATRSGFRSSRYFRRVFVRSVGLTPTQYRLLPDTDLPPD